MGESGVIDTICGSIMLSGAHKIINLDKLIEVLYTLYMVVFIVLIFIFILPIIYGFLHIFLNKIVDLGFLSLIIFLIIMVGSMWAQFFINY